LYKIKVYSCWILEEVEPYDILALATRILSHKEGVDHIEDFDLIFKCFEVHGLDTHVYNLLEVPCGFLFTLRAWFFRMDEICANFYLCGLDRFDPLVLVLYGDVIIFAGSIEQLMM